MNYETLASDFHTAITSSKKGDVFEHISDEQFEQLKVAFTSETRKRNEKRYYRFECPKEQAVIWCIESKLGTNLKNQKFKEHLLLLGGGKKRADRNNNHSVYFHPTRANKALIPVDELECFFSNDPKGKAMQPIALTKRPTRVIDMTI